MSYGKKTPMSTMLLTPECSEGLAKKLREVINDCQPDWDGSHNSTTPVIELDFDSFGKVNMILTTFGYRDFPRLYFEGFFDLENCSPRARQFFKHYGKNARVYVCGSDVDIVDQRKQFQFVRVGSNWS